MSKKPNRITLSKYSPIGPVTSTSPFSAAVNGRGVPKYFSFAMSRKAWLCQACGKVIPRYGTVFIDVDYRYRVCHECAHDLKGPIPGK